MSGQGFKDLVEAFIKIGAKFGENKDVDDLLPDATTVSRKLKPWADEKKMKASADIQKAVNESKIAITTDL